MASVTAQGVRVQGRLGGIDLSVKGGEVHALVGPNGSGKSTLLSVLAGDLRPDSGSVTISVGDSVHDVSRLEPRRAARIRALLAQDTAVAFPFAVRDVISWGRVSWAGTAEQASDEAVIDEVIETHGLRELVDRPVTSLSAGERARVHLARVLAQRAPILLLDEADAALDLSGQAHLDRAVRARRDEGDAVVIVGHDLGRLSALADTATLMSQGRALAQGPASTVLTADALTRAYGVAVSATSHGERRFFWSTDET